MQSPSHLSPLICIIFVIVATVNATVDFAACQQRIQNGTYKDIIGLDVHGHPIDNISLAKGVNYTTCVDVCGSGFEAFNWTIFSQQFNSWFIPWLALTSQLPLGAEDRLDNLMSVLLAIGSPALATYSLVITLLNNRWLDLHLANIRFPTTKHAAIVLSALQHIPIELGGPDQSDTALRSLIALSWNDRWWSEMAKHAKKTRKWNMPAAMNIAWVIIAWMITIADSIYDLSFPYSNGHAVAAIWMWLLPVVIGWLRVGSQDESGHLREALERCNRDYAYIATTEAADPRLARDSGAWGIAPRKSGIETKHIWNDERREAPIFNYSRVLDAMQMTEHIVQIFEAAHNRAANRKTINGKKWVYSDNELDTIHEDNRKGNITQVNWYLGTEAPSEHYLTLENHRTGRQLLRDFNYRSSSSSQTLSQSLSQAAKERMIGAIMAALFLQWCTTGAAIMIPVLTPTIGLGCRSMSFLIYGTVATISFFSFIISSLLAHACRPGRVGDPRKGFMLSKAVRGSVVGFRGTGKTLAILNVPVVMAACAFQFSNVFSNCYCLSSVIGLGKTKAYALFLTGTDMIALGVRRAWLGGVGVALGGSLLFGVFIYVATTRR